MFGRQTEGPGQLANDPELSRHHAQITRRTAGEYLLEDLSSTNGTCVNGTRLAEPLVLSLGDTIELGTTKLVVRALPAPAAPEIDVRAATAVTDVPAAIRTPTPPPSAPAAAGTPHHRHLHRHQHPHHLRLRLRRGCRSSDPPPRPHRRHPRPPAPSPPPPLLDLRLRVDLERAEAEVALGEGQAVRLRLQEGRWQIVNGDSR